MQCCKLSLYLKLHELKHKFAVQVLNKIRCKDPCLKIKRFCCFFFFSSADLRRFRELEAEANYNIQQYKQEKMRKEHVREEEKKRVF